MAFLTSRAAIAMTVTAEFASAGTIKAGGVILAAPNNPILTLFSDDIFVSLNFQTD
jgi:hypothetical protein